MPTHNIIERAFELARDSYGVEDIRKILRKEGYASVDAHLCGASIRAELNQMAR